MILVVSTYLLVAFAAVIGANTDGLSISAWFASQGATGFAEAVGSLAPFGIVLVGLAAIFSSTSALNATLFSSARVSFAMSRDGFLPPILSKISKNHVPHMALFASSVIVLTVALLLDVEGVAAAADIMFLLIFLLINVSVIKIRREMSDELQYGFMMPFFPAIPIIALVLQLLLAINLFEMSMLAWLSAGVWIMAGVIIYFVYAKKHGEKFTPFILLEENLDKAKRDYQIMMPVQHGHISETLAVYTSRIAHETQAALLLASVVSLPHYAPKEEAAKGLLDAAPYVKAAGGHIVKSVPVSTVIGRSETAARGIVALCKERKTNLMVLGWKGYTETKGYKMGTTLDRVIEHAPCDIVVIKPGETGLHTGEKIKRILIPSNGTYHSFLAARMAIALLDHASNAKITVLNINNSGESRDRIERRLAPMCKVLKHHDYEIVIHDREDVMDAILEEAETHDLVVLGANNEGMLTRMLFGKLNERIAEHCKKTIMLAKTDLGVRSWISRWIGRRG